MKSVALYQTNLLSFEWVDQTTLLFQTLQRLRHQQYADFPSDIGHEEVEDALSEILHILGSPYDKNVHQRYVYIGWALALAAQPTIKYYYPNDARSDVVLSQVALWMTSPFDISASADALFPEMATDTAFGGPQAADEAYQMFYNLLRSLDSKQAYDATLDILVDGMTGDPIIASSCKKRRLFDWLLVDVVPSAYYLRLASAFYWQAWPFVPLESREEDQNQDVI